MAVFITVLSLVLIALKPAIAADALPSWKDGPAKQAIVTFVGRVTAENTPDYVPPAERIAVFDNDGTLWSEQPAYFQLLFAIDRVKSLADQNPAWRIRQPFKAVLENDMPALARLGKKGLAEIVMATHAGMSTEEFEKIVSEWIATARHPISGRLYTQMVYQPMQELLQYLRENGFKTFIVSGGGIEFMRPWVEQVYGIPPEQVIGSKIKVEYVVSNGKPILRRLADLDFMNDKAGKPIGIHAHIGRRPIAAFGNSDGDFQMLEWTTSGNGPRLGMIVHHDDDVREVAYDRGSRFGELYRGLDEAETRGWILISMKSDWSRVFPDP